MKKIIKYTMVVFAMGLMLNSCETTNLELRDNPNALTSADPNLLLNQIQFNYNNIMTNYNNLSSNITRITYMFGRDYFNNFQGPTLNGVWTNTYVGLGTSLQELERIDAESTIDYSFHIGVTKAMYAHSLFQLVDYMGEAAFSQANNAAEFPAPTLDSGQDVYAAAFNLLTEAEALLASNPSAQGATDFFYAGDASQWVKMINSVRLKAYVTTSNSAGFNSVIAGGNFISDTADDLQFQYGTRQLQPDTRHPDYIADYTPAGANIYQSNWLMEYMLDNNDPRIRYYFYRQEDATPGADAPANEETLVCSLVVPPQHYLDGGFTYCSVPNGYWGRSHGNDEGTPPDNFRRAAVGVYPSGGRFDDNSFDVVGLGLGGGGAGIEPIILASYVDFWRADMATSDADKSTFLRAAIEKSIAKVQSFGALDGPSDKSFEPSAADVTTYVDDVIAAYDAATGDAKENIFAEQYWVALYGGAAEAFNFYRKTGFPNTLLPNWEPNPGPFPRTFLYPQNEVITNPNLTQKATLTDQVFWDTNPASPAFPPAN